MATAARKTSLMTKAEVRSFIEALATHNPAPETELSFTDPFTLLVAVVLSAQATDVSVNRATQTLFKVAPTPQAMIGTGGGWRCSPHPLDRLWQTKARNVVQLARALIGKARGPGAAEPRSVGSSSGCWPKDRQRGAERGVRRKHHGGRHAHLPAWATARALRPARRRVRWRTRC